MPKASPPPRNYAFGRRHADDAANAASDAQSMTNTLLGHRPLAGYDAMTSAIESPALLRQPRFLRLEVLIYMGTRRAY